MASPQAFYPLPTTASLQNAYIGAKLDNVLTPAAILDRAIVRRNCTAMLQVSAKLGVTFRAHVKSHKTLEIAKLQVGDDDGTAANFVVSTLIEAENLVPFVVEAQARGRECSIIYGVPIPQSAVPRLLNLASRLKPGTINVLIDNQTAYTKFISQPGVAAAHIGVFVKVDAGYERAGIKTQSPKFADLVRTIVDKSGSDFHGFYTHFGHSYAGNSEDDAANGLIEELTGLEAAAKAVPASFEGRLVLTVGATPTATAAQNMLSSDSPRVAEFYDVLKRLGQKYTVELHAGVYPLLDCQQVATHARPADAPAGEGFQPLSKENIGFKILVDVSSVYDERAKPEALVSAGSLAMGREPCKSYPGWGIVTGELGNEGTKVYDERGERTGWIVGRISQEHGLLTWEGPREEASQLTIGDKLLIWTNHACIASAGFGWYLVVDSDLGGDEIVDVWVRWRGW